MILFTKQAQVIFHGKGGHLVCNNIGNVPSLDLLIQYSHTCSMAYLGYLCITYISDCQITAHTTQMPDNYNLQHQ